MTLYDCIVKREEKISVIGLGYVGLPLAIAFARVADVIGFDISEEKVRQYRCGIDVTREVGDQAIRETTAFSLGKNSIRSCKFHIVAVPTPIKDDKTPDLGPPFQQVALSAEISPGSIVVYESTVYPGVTEEVCAPLLEEASGLKCGVDFKIGYSPERINPGDKVHRLETIVKVVSGMDEESLETIAKVYELVVDAGVYRAETIRVAEAAKVIENAQRDINIAFMNELAIIFNKLNIDTLSVLNAAKTKWNFLPFTPGLVGGHCIGVDPYYLTYKAEQIGYHSQIILAGRKINDDMGKYVAENVVKNMIRADKPVKGIYSCSFGITFKENCPDVRNTKVVDVINELKECGVTVRVVDPVADEQDLLRTYGITLSQQDEVRVWMQLSLLWRMMSLGSNLEDVKSLYNNHRNAFFSDEAATTTSSVPTGEAILIDVKYF